MAQTGEETKRGDSPLSGKTQVEYKFSPKNEKKRPEDRSAENSQNGAGEEILD